MSFEDLTDDEKAAVIALLRATLRDAKYPMSPRNLMLRAILEKLDANQRRPELPPPSPPMVPPRSTRRGRWR